jgi:hypothetical protein
MNLSSKTEFESKKEKSLVPDITAFDTPQYPNEPLDIDCIVTQSFPGSNNPLNPTFLKQKLANNFFTKIIENKDHNCREAHRAELVKINKYINIASINGRRFLPFVMETNGYINIDGVKFLESLSKRASVIHSIPETNLLKYFKSLLSISLQKSISNLSKSLHTPRELILHFIILI